MSEAAGHQPPTATGFRVFSDASGSSTIVGTVNFGELPGPLTLNSLFVYIYDMAPLDDDSEFHLVGVDGGRKCPLTTDNGVQKFFMEC